MYHCNLLFSVSEISEWIVSTLSAKLGNGYSLLYNAIGVVAIFLQIMIFQMRSKKNIVLLGLFSNIGWMSYFSLQGDLISCTSGIIGIVSKIIILLGAKHRWADSKWWSVCFLAFAGTYSAFTFKGMMDIFAFVASMLSVSAYFMKKENDIRKLFLFAYCAYICNSISKLYVVALIADVTALISVIVSLIRYRKKDKEEELGENQVTESMEEELAENA
ncbi:MAG: YgjV family protein [Clostridiales bacterium]|nr:YgjV family protein [Clostridiales bacterium]